MRRRVEFAGLAACRTASFGIEHRQCILQLSPEPRCNASLHSEAVPAEIGKIPVGLAASTFGIKCNQHRPVMRRIGVHDAHDNGRKRTVLDGGRPHGIPYGVAIMFGRLIAIPSLPFAVRPLTLP